MNRRKYDRLYPKKEDDGLVCHPHIRGGFVLVEPDKVHSAHAGRMARIDQMRPEYRQLLNYFPRLPGDLTADLLAWDRANVPIDAVMRTLRERHGTIVDAPPFEPPAVRRPVRGEPRPRRLATDVAPAPVEAIPTTPPGDGGAICGVRL